jgi:hypothetical protein
MLMMEKATAPAERYPSSSFAHCLQSLLDERSLTLYQAALEADLNPALLEEVMDGRRKPSRLILERLSVSPNLGVSYKTLSIWALLDDYSPASVTEASVYLG